MAIKIRGFEELVDKLDEDSQWRKKEISSMKSVIQSENQPDYLVRAGFVMLCAHFEGFIRFASNAYIAYISSQKIKISRMKPSFTAIKLRSEAKNYFVANNGEKVKTTTVKNLIEEYHLLLEKEFIMKMNDDNMPFVDEDSPPIATESNPSSKVLKEITSILDINYDNLFLDRTPFIDGEILEPRNHIAHGRRRPLEYDAYIAVYDYILHIIDQYKEVIVSEAKSSSFLVSQK